MRILTTLIATAAALYGLWWYGTSHPEIRSHIESYLHSASFKTLEVRFSAAQIMDMHKRELLRSSRHKFLEPELAFYPYVLLDVKYRYSDSETREGVVLWDLVDGEMVIDTKDWIKTHGFGDCISAEADRNEFRILNVLANKGGACDRETLSKALHTENETLDRMLESCRRKKLVVQNGNRYRLHLQQPRLKTRPETKIEERLVTKTAKNAERVSRIFTLSQIEQLARSAFGQDFTIRRTTDVYLPVYCLVVQNPDGSRHRSHWNALNGKRLMQAYFTD